MSSKSNFFAKNEAKTIKKRKQTGKSKLDNNMKVKKRKLEEDITSESENEEVAEVESDLSDNETAIEKRNRLAKKMLDEINEKFSQEDGDIKNFLKKEILEKSGRLFHNVAAEYQCPSEDDVKFSGWSSLGAVTCVAVSSDNKFIFSGCKDGHIVKWSLPTGKKLDVIKGIRKKDITKDVGHSDEVMSLALSKDFKFLATGGRDNVVHVWNPSTMKHLHTFQGHKSHIMGLCFQVGTHMLYSASQDKSIKIWNLDEMAYVETLFGHENGVMSVDCLSHERAISAGSGDNSARFWKIPEESHLVFHGHSGYIDCVKFIDNSHFLSAASDNSLALWSTQRKKPIVTVNNAHGTSEQWITSIAVYHKSDLAVSGSYDGNLQFWSIGPGFKSLDRLFTLKLDGYVNSLMFSEDGQYLVAGIGKEHRLGRWFETIKSVKNSIAIIKLKKRGDPVENEK